MTTTDHPLTETDAAETLLAASGKRRAEFKIPDDWEAILRGFRAAFDAGREHERAQADPHHDPRPWQDCARKDICAGDLVETQCGDLLYVGVAHHQDSDGDWLTERGHLLTNGYRWPLRRIPAPTPPAEEVELPTEFGAVITDVEVDLGETVRLDCMVWTGRRWTYHYYSAAPEFVLTCTLPDGTRARRDGERADGTPRFIKDQEQT